MQRTLLAVLGLIAFLLIWEAAPYLGLAAVPAASQRPAHGVLREIQAGYWFNAVLASLSTISWGWRWARASAWRWASPPPCTTGWMRRCPG